MHFLMEEFISLGNKAANLKASIMEVAAAKCIKMGKTEGFYSAKEFITLCMERCEELMGEERMVYALIAEKQGEILENGTYELRLDIEIETAMMEFRDAIVKAENLLAKVSK